MSIEKCAFCAEPVGVGYSQERARARLESGEPCHLTGKMTYEHRYVWVAYYTDFSAFPVVFATEIEARRFAMGHGMLAAKREFAEEGSPHD